MFSMIKSRKLDQVHSRDENVNKCHYGEDVNFYIIRYWVAWIKDYLFIHGYVALLGIG